MLFLYYFFYHKDFDKFKLSSHIHNISISVDI